MNVAQILDISVITTSFFLIVSVSTASLCRNDQYWQSITGSCESCSGICDPPTRHENDCPARCPKYVPTTKTTASTETDGHGIPSWIIILISVIPGAILVIIIVGTLTIFIRKQQSTTKAGTIKPMQEEGDVEKEHLPIEQVDIGNTERVIG